MTLDMTALRQDFPLLSQQAHGKPLVYLDNAATTQKPKAVLESLTHYYQTQNSNVHRGAHTLADAATAAFEGARQKVADFLNADRKEIIWTRGTTEALNLVAQCYGRVHLKAGDEVLISSYEHHANLVPWQQACQASGATLKVIPLREDQSLDLDAFHHLLNHNTRILAIGQISNTLGSVAPLAEMIPAARDVGAAIVVDGAQAVAHLPIDVKALDCDFYAFSAHKMYGPTGIGVLYGKRELLEAMPPWQTGGEMIETVSFDNSTWTQLPWKFEAGTPNIAAAIGLGAAVDWLQQQDREVLAHHERDLINYAMERARAFKGLRIIGNDPNKSSILSFLLEGGHPSDVGMLLDQQGIAVRTGHHCTMPLMQLLGIPGTVRASFTAYNTRDEVDALFNGLEKVTTFL